MMKVLVTVGYSTDGQYPILLFERVRLFLLFLLLEVTFQ